MSEREIIDIKDIAASMYKINLDIQDLLNTSNPIDLKTAILLIQLKDLLYETFMRIFTAQSEIFERMLSQTKRSVI